MTMKIIAKKNKNSIVEKKLNIGGQDPCCGGRA
jgi:hypothetical protein